MRPWGQNKRPPQNQVIPPCPLSLTGSAKEGAGYPDKCLRNHREPNITSQSWPPCDSYDRDTLIALLLLGQMIAALRANYPDFFKCLLSGTVQGLGEPLVEELLLDWLDPFLTLEEQDRLLGWHLGGVSNHMREKSR